MQDSSANYNLEVKLKDNDQMGTAFSKYSRWIVGGVLLIAGVLKLVTPDNLIEVFFFFGMSDDWLIYFLVYGLSILEIVLAFALILNLKPKLTSFTVSVLCINFLLISILGYTHDWELACGCLGEFTYGNFDLAMVLRNSVLVGLSGLIVIQSFRENAPQRGTTETKQEKS